MISDKTYKIKDKTGFFKNASTAGQYFIYNPNNDTNEKRINWDSYQWDPMGIGQASNYVFTCRESLEHYLRSPAITPNNLIGFHYIRNGIPALDIKIINNFFLELEEKLNLTGEQKTVFCRTNIDSVIMCEVPDFWNENSLKRNMFSLFLRCAAVYNKGNIKDSIKNYPLAYSIYSVIMWFLEGNTKLTNIGGYWKEKGICTTVEYIGGQEAMKKYLTKPS